MLSANDIRRTFIEFFDHHGHQQVPSSPLVPRNDPTLMFVNSGMVQFKNVFTGQEQRPYSRAVTAQKSVRAGGKHNDLENVGYTARHHTFFEMMGNFSFGDYFKDLAIELAWKLVTEEFGLNKEKLLVTVYAEDDEAATLWRKIADLPDQRIIRIPTSDNFWQMGDTGPCGPCSEIFYDHGPDIPGGPPGSPDEDGDRFIEIWNLVFMQFEQFLDRDREPLPKPSIDTGMGLERMAAVLQNQHNNYDIDLFRTLIEASVELTGRAAKGEDLSSHRVIADHLRASAFLIADGVLPSNEGRGYVLRRIMRRAMRHIHQLGAKEPLMYRLLPALVSTMGGHYQELRRAESLISETLKLEETGFRRTLERGLKLLDEATGKLRDGADLPGDIAFMLYDTCGFPVDLTRDILRKQGRGIDEAAFDAAMQRQREQARQAWKGSGEKATDRVWFELGEKISATDFLGYETEQAEGEIQALVVDGEPVESAKTGSDVIVIFNQTPFYGESGGQAGDKGTLYAENGTRVAIHDCQKRLGLFLHIGRVEEGQLEVGNALTLRVDPERRQALRGNHSVTHLAHAALRARLGDHVTQKGSLVESKSMRFDFSHPKPMTPEDILAVETMVNRQIQDNVPVSTRLMTPDEAIKTGALALFGEKYGEEVRVVFMQSPEEEAQPYSIELCGGTHVARTGDIGLFKIIGEQGVAAGVRRIECLSGTAAFSYLNDQDQRMKVMADRLRVAPGDVPERLFTLIDERKRNERQILDLKRTLASQLSAAAHTESGQAQSDEADHQLIGDIKLVTRSLSDLPPKELKPLADQLKTSAGSGVIALATVSEGKASLVVGVTDDLTDRIDAVTLVRSGVVAIGGKGGGGRPDLAQAGGPDGEKTGAALQAIEEALKRLVQEKSG